MSSETDVPAAWCQHCRADVEVEWIAASQVPPRHVRPDPQTMVEASHTMTEGGRLVYHQFDMPQDRAADLVAALVQR